MESLTTVTTSWDDGHVLDLELAPRLRRHGLQATFYVAPDNRQLDPAQRLPADQVARLADDFEIGAHTLTHPWLTSLTPRQAWQEVAGSRATLERVVGPVRSFCYPGGRFSEVHREMVAAAGFTYARTVERFALSAPPDPLAAATTAHAYRHWSDVGRIAWFSRAAPARAARNLLAWDDLAIALFDEAHARRGLFHLWGHSWEIEAHRDWDRLERVLRHISGRPDVRYVTNGALP